MRLENGNFDDGMEAGDGGSEDLARRLMAYRKITLVMEGRRFVDGELEKAA